MEYGSLQYMGARQVHLEKLDRIQRKAQRICGCEFRSLESRRRAVAYGLACKLLDGEGRGQLQDFKPDFKPEGRTRQGVGLGLRPQYDAKSLDLFRNSFLGQIDGIFDDLPQELLFEGFQDGWRKTMKRGQKLLGEMK